MAPSVQAFGDFLDDLCRKGLQIAGIAGCDHTLVNYHRRITSLRSTLTGCPQSFISFDLATLGRNDINGRTGLLQPLEWNFKLRGPTSNPTACSH